MVGDIPKLKLIFLTNFDFNKKSGAAWDRIMNYSKIFPLDEFQLVIVSSFYDLSKGIKVQKNHGVEYIYSNQKARSSRLKDLNFISNWRFCKQVYRLYDNEKNVRYYLYNINLSIVFSSLFYLKVIRSQKVFTEKNELETAIALNSSINKKSIFSFVSSIFIKSLRIFFGLNTDFLAVFFNGIFAISKNIEKIYKPFNSNVNYIPILINPEDSNIQNRNIVLNTDFKVGYFGWISEKKDGVFSLINAINILTKRYSVSLHIFGESSQDVIMELKRKTNSNVIYHGNIAQKDVLFEAAKYDLLTLVRPENLQTRFGFSTKLGTYLLSSKPVLITNVSDHKYYFNNNENAFVMESKNKIDVNILSEKLEKIILTPDKDLNRIGVNGMNTAIKYFSIDKYRELLTSKIL